MKAGDTVYVVAGWFAGTSGTIHKLWSSQYSNVIKDCVLMHRSDINIKIWIRTKNLSIHNPSDPT